MPEGTLFYVLALLLPAYIALSFDAGGIAIGAFVFWGLIIFAILSTPETLGLGWIFAMLWIAVGWAIGFVYCTAIVLIQKFLIKILQRL